MTIPPLRCVRNSQVGFQMAYSDAIQRVFGQRVDGQPLFSFWTHFPDADMDADSLAEATISFQREFNLDFVKTAPNGMYAIEDLGVTLDFSDVPKGGVAQVVDTPFEKPEAWDRLPDPDFTRGALARELRALKLVREALPDAVIVFTVFSPMTIAAKLSRGRIYDHIADRENAATVHTALGRLADTVRDYSAAAIAAGAHGVFYAHQDTGGHLLGYDDFSEFVVPYDMQALLGAQAGQFNVLHVHGDQIRFTEVQDYPVHALNWHDWETRPRAAAGLLSSGKCVVGGIDRWLLTNNDVAAAKRQIDTVLAETRGLGDLILAPSCTIRAGFSAHTFHAVRDYIRGLPADSDSKQPTA